MDSEEVNYEVYFTSNTTVVFLPGNHTLDTNITVGNVTRLMMYGESSSDNLPTVVCNGPVGLSFTSMGDFKLHVLKGCFLATYLASWTLLCGLLFVKLLTTVMQGWYKWWVNILYWKVYIQVLVKILHDHKCLM